MSAVLQPHSGTAEAAEPLVDASNVSAWSRLTDAQRDVVETRLRLIAPALERMRGGGVSVSLAAKWLRARLPLDAAPSLSTLERYISAARSGDMAALAPRYVGRVRKPGGWEARALYYRRLPSQVSYAAIAKQLVEEDGFAADDATPKRVQRYLESLPTDQVDYHGDRVGPHYRRLNLTPKHQRDRTVLKVGMLYQGDGHSLHYYVRHPDSGHHITAELTPWMDIRSRYIVGWWLGYSESAVQTLYSLSHAIVAFDHVPAMLHVDPGSGFKNRVMCDEVAGFAARLGGLEFMTALPGNAPGKGDIEGWFKWFEADHGKFQPSFKGADVPQEFLRRLDKRIERGEMYIPTWDEALAGIARYVQRYNERKQDELGSSPASIFETGLQRSQLHFPPAMLMRPREIRTARSYEVQLWKRTFRAPGLTQYEGKKVQVEYDLHSWSFVSIYDMQGRYVCEAKLVNTIGFLPDSRIADLSLKQQHAALKRLDHKQDLVRANHRATITAEDSLRALQGFGADELPPQEQTEGLQPLDLTDTDY